MNLRVKHKVDVVKEQRPQDQTARGKCRGAHQLQCTIREAKAEQVCEVPWLVDKVEVCHNTKTSQRADDAMSSNLELCRESAVKVQLQRPFVRGHRPIVPDHLPQLVVQGRTS